MPTYIALLRGINVSGQKKIKMAELRQQLSAAGLKRVQTYIQSGNILFEHPAAPEGHLSAKIAGTIRAAYGFEVPVLVLTAAQLESIARANPLKAEAEADPRRTLVTFLEAVPEIDAVEALESARAASEQFRHIGKAIYLHCPDGYGRTKLNNNFIERKLKVPATTRNWKTVAQLLHMAASA